MTTPTGPTFVLILAKENNNPTVTIDLPLIFSTLTEYAKATLRFREDTGQEIPEKIPIDVTDVFDTAAKSVIRFVKESEYDTVTKFIEPNVLKGLGQYIAYILNLYQPSDTNKEPLILPLMPPPPDDKFFLPAYDDIPNELIAVFDRIVSYKVANLSHIANVFDFLELTMIVRYILSFIVENIKNKDGKQLRDGGWLTNSIRKPDDYVVFPPGRQN